MLKLTPKRSMLKLTPKRSMLKSNFDGVNQEVYAQIKQGWRKDKYRRS